MRVLGLQRPGTQARTARTLQIRGGNERGGPTKADNDSSYPKRRAGRGTWGTRGIPEIHGTRENRETRGPRGTRETREARGARGTRSVFFRTIIGLLKRLGVYLFIGIPSVE